jgi:hypothetical protein
MKGIAPSLVCAALFAAPGLVQAESRFDGTWEGIAEAAGDCREVRLAFTITDNRLSGWLSGSRGTANLSGSVSADGSAAIRFAGASQFEGR